MGIRTIIFRGKRVDNGEWVEGYYVYDESGQIAEKDIAFIYCLNKHPCGYALIPYEVIPETVGQYTGLRDCKRTEEYPEGQKIFEGDICQTKGYKLIDEKPFEIVWNDYYSGWFWQDIEVSRETDILTKTVAELTEVIGNIHDNPELLKEGDSDAR